VRLEGLGKLKKKDVLIGNRTLDLPACNTGPQATLLSVPLRNYVRQKVGTHFPDYMVSHLRRP
jgi:hypothetical protein